MLHDPRPEETGPGRHQRRLKLCERAGLTPRQMVAVMLTWNGRSEARIAKVLRVKEKAVGQLLTSAANRLDEAFGGRRKRGLSLSEARQLLRAMEARPWPEDPFSDCHGDWYSEGGASKPFGLVAEDIARPATEYTPRGYLAHLDEQIYGEPVPA